SALSASTGAGTVCGSCRPLLQEVVGQASWMPVTISQSIHVADGIRTVRFLPLDGQFTPHLPAQHVLVQALIDGHWVQRPYPIPPPGDGAATEETGRRREPQGFSPPGLSERPAPKMPMRLPGPQGDFSVALDRREPVACVVAGIGMTPALAICRSLLRRHDDR